MADQILQTAQAVLRDPSVKMFLSQLSGQISKAVEEKLAAAGIKPIGKAEEAPPVAVLTEEQKIKLQNAKNKMERAEVNLKEYNSLLNRFLGFLKGGSRAAVEEEFEKAKSEYEKLKKEFGV